MSRFFELSDDDVRVSQRQPGGYEVSERVQAEFQVQENHQEVQKRSYGFSEVVGGIKIVIQACFEGSWKQRIKKTWL